MKPAARLAPASPSRARGAQCHPLQQVGSFPFAPISGIMAWTASKDHLRRRRACAVCWSIAQTTAALIRSPSTAINGRTIFGFVLGCCDDGLRDRTEREPGSKNRSSPGVRKRLRDCPRWMVSNPCEASLASRSSLAPLHVPSDHRPAGSDCRCLSPRYRKLGPPATRPGRC